MQPAFRRLRATAPAGDAAGPARTTHGADTRGQPPAQAIKGATYSYPIAVRSKKGGVKLRLDAGPNGMKVTPEGKLTWDVPANFAEPEVDVILTVGDASGQEVFHTFKIAVAQ